MNKTPLQRFAEKLGITKGAIYEKALKEEKHQMIFIHIQGQLHDKDIIGNIPREIKDAAIKYFNDSYHTEP